jgi:hypothetical protein
MNKYNIPVFKPAENCSLSLLMLFSMDALHMEHWAKAFNRNKDVAVMSKKAYNVFLNIFNFSTLIIRPD